MTVHCDFCGRAIEGDVYSVEIRMTAQRVSSDGVLFRQTYFFTRVACEPACAQNHGEGIDAGVIETRRALEARMAKTIAQMNFELESAKRSR